MLKGGVLASASATSTTSQILLNEFEEYWRLFGCGAEWDHEKQNAKNYWMQQMHQDKRDKILNQLRAGRRWRTKANDNPYFYIKNFNEQLPFMNDGTPEFMSWMESCRDSKKQIVLVMYNRKPVYCLKTDLPIMERAGATYLRDFQIPNT